MNLNLELVLVNFSSRFCTSYKAAHVCNVTDKPKRLLTFTKHCLNVSHYRKPRCINNYMF